MIDYKNIADGSVLGINYSGMHDSAIAIVSPDGVPQFAAAYERFSRVKQDGRPFSQLLDGLPWEKIAKVAVSAPKEFVYPTSRHSKLLQVRLSEPRQQGLLHGEQFEAFLAKLPVEKVFVEHQIAHVASAFWGSRFDRALCLTYDGGMCNSPWFGGLYDCTRSSGITPLDQFSALDYAKVTSLYSFVTALLGFTPNKHEGKITGLAAFGQPTASSRALMKKWFEEDFLLMESVMAWFFTYDEQRPAVLLPDETKLEPFRQEAIAFSPQVLAATVQEFAEQHVIELLARARAQGWNCENICLAGGLFANVKINQRVVEQGFKNLFVAPPMTDDGTALGAAWHVLSKGGKFDPKPLHSMYLGPSYDAGEILPLLESEGIRYSQPEVAADAVAEKLAAGKVVAVFQGAMEFGPRALGNRSILAQASRNDINQNLNKRLNRTEFMPFAPMTRVEDAERCYLDIERVSHAAEFMTVTVNCRPEMQEKCPAVVHVDGTARPQLVSEGSNPLIHAIITRYVELTDRPSIVNTSFNIHEEPIVCSPLDALKGFFESGLDYLYLDGGFLIDFAENKEVALRFLQRKVAEPNAKVIAQSAMLKEQMKMLSQQQRELVEKEAVIGKLLADCAALRKREKEQGEELHDFYRTYGSWMPFRALWRSIFRLSQILRPRLGWLHQYAPRPLTTAGVEVSRNLRNYPTISIVTPSYGQGEFIEHTLRSVLDQNYPALEYYVQDGGSKDDTVQILQRYADRLDGWESARDNGQSHAINLGLARTSGDIMAWLNSDDFLMPGALARVADFFDRHPDVDVVYGDRLICDEQGQEIGRWVMPSHDDNVLSWADFIPQETMFWRRRIWEKAGGKIDESFRFAMDWDLLMRFREAGAKFAHIPAFLGVFRVHSQQKTSAVIHEIGIQEMNRIRERVLGRVPTRREIRKSIRPYLLRHLAVDMWYRIKRRFAA
ncbi:carbamoyltransferase C-terminal domain-containing protein [uncultured Herbaspirillum sp.]|uniref:carbamoyltransferase C-terminal domain-containing protein n=1 Tax=uncultured Herbaspirillum sp. TaxID=160236 RepID=UPI00258F3EAB|nr:carbamoyltransferase C-terminal domain-containing protein [uncultured Herbaspirillum sp.]